MNSAAFFTKRRKSMNYANIKYLDTANGIGIRTSLFVSGCKNGCKGCFNAVAWPFDYGKRYDVSVQKEVLESIKKPHVQGLSILGGDPFELENQPDVLRLIEAFREEFKDTKDIWMWTGYLLDKDLAEGGRRYVSGITDKILANINYLVDGPFMLDKKNLMLKYKGSSNQRVIDVRKTLANGKIKLFVTD